MLDALLHWPTRQPIVRRLLGWSVVAVGVYLLITQVLYVVHERHGLPGIRHPIFWSKSLFRQAMLNRNTAIGTDVAPFYLIARELAGKQLIVGPALAIHSWRLERVGRVRVTISEEIVEVPAEAWKALTFKPSFTALLGPRKLYVHLGARDVTTYVLVATLGDGPAYIVPEDVYRFRVVDSRGANLSAP
jgi:hypothetical protein